MKKLVLAALLAGIATAGTVAISSAGVTHAMPVTITSSTVNGSIGYVRNSTSTRESLGCYVRHTSSTIAGCQAMDRNGTYRQCVTRDPALIDLIQSLNGDSYISFRYSGGTCSNVTVMNKSTLAPK